MEKQFIPYELALKLKELGFDEECFGYYTVDEVLNLDSLKIFKDGDLTTITSQSDWTTLAPLWQQAFDWFREKHNLHCVIDEYENPKSWGYLINNDDLDEAFSFSSYKEARQACLEKLIELCKNN